MVIVVPCAFAFSFKSAEVFTLCPLHNSVLIKNIKKYLSITIRE